MTRKWYRDFTLNSKWFKVKITSRRDPNDVDYSYVSGHNKYQVKFDLTEAMSPRYFVQVKEIPYDQIIKECYREKSVS